VSPEFFTKVRFEQFGMEVTSGRIGAAIIGWKNTWKTGFGLTLILTLVGLIHPNAKSMAVNTLKAIFINLFVAFLFGIVGLTLGMYFNQISGLKIPDIIVEKKAFMAVEQMHNFSNIGGLIGLCIAVIWQMFSLKKANAEHA
jgi:hypothetical protein